MFVVSSIRRLNEDESICLVKLLLQSAVDETDDAELYSRYQTMKQWFESLIQTERLTLTEELGIDLDMFLGCHSLYACICLVLFAIGGYS